MDYLINGAVIICNPFERKKNGIPIFNQTEVNEKGIIFCFSLKAQIANIFGLVSLMVTTICHCNAKATHISYKRMGVASLTHIAISTLHLHTHTRILSQMRRQYQILGKVMPNLQGTTKLFPWYVSIFEHQELGTEMLEK